MSEFPMLGSRAFKYSPIGGSSYIKTPKSIIGKRAIINVKNDDEKCFLYSILAHFKKFEQNNNRVSQYKQHLHELRTDGIDMPMKLEDITKFEKLNGLSINVYSIEENGGNVNPIRISKENLDPINLLLIIGSDHQHYTYISNFDRLLSFSGHPKSFCPYCMYGFDKRYKGEEKLKKHILECKENAPARVEFPPRGQRTIKFNMFAKQLKAPLIAIADFEAANEEVTEVNDNTSKTTCLTEHKITGFCIQLVGSYDGIGPFKPIHYTGVNATQVFLQEMKQINLMMEDLYNKGGKEVMHNLTPSQQKAYDDSSDCHICGGDITCDLTMDQWQVTKTMFVSTITYNNIYLYFLLG